MWRILVSLFLSIPLLTLTGSISIERCLAATSANIELTDKMPGESMTSDSFNGPGIQVTSQYSSLSLRLSLPRQSFLTGENTEVTVSTNLSGTQVSLYYEINNNRTAITAATINGSQRFSIKTPDRAGQARLICEGNATVIYWTTCTGVQVCGYDVNGLPNLCTYTYPCQREMVVYDTAATEFRNYGRNTSISGTIYDSFNRPVNDASVQLSNGTSRTTATNGLYTFDDFLLGDNYRLEGGVPTVDATITVDAVACKQQSKNISIQAEQPLNGVDINLNRVFYPPRINPSNFTFSAFSGWPAAHNVSTWEDILAITPVGNAQLSSIYYGGSGLTTTPLEFKSFILDNQNLYLLPGPKTGRHRLDFAVNPPGKYDVYAAANLKGIGPLKEISAPGKGEKPVEKFSLAIGNRKFDELKQIDILDWTLVLILVAAGILGGLVATFLVLGRKRGWFDKLKGAVKAPGLKKPITDAKQIQEGKQEIEEAKTVESKETKQLQEGKATKADESKQAP